MAVIWKGPGVLWGKNRNDDPVHPDQPIPEGHVTKARLGELGDRVQEQKDAPKPSPAPVAKPPTALETPPDSVETSPASKPPPDTSQESTETKPKRGPGRPKGSGKK